MSAQSAPDRMSNRARVYMGIAATRHVLLGAMCIVRPQDFTSGSYQGIKSALPFSPDVSLIAWGIIFAAVGVVCGASAVTARDHKARLGLLLSCITTAFWVGGFIASIFAGTSAGWSGVIIWAAITAKDLTMLRDPLTTPFEPLIRKEMTGGGR